MLRIRDSVRVPGRVHVTYALLSLNLLSFLAVGAMNAIEVFSAGGVIPAVFFDQSKLDPQLLALRPPGLVTVIWSQFLHQGWPHLLSNGISLLIFGPNVEARMGRARFLLFYLSCGAFGMLCQVVSSPHSMVPIIGASGAISGLFGAYFALFPDHFIRITVGNIRRDYRDFVIPVKVVLIVWLISEVFNSLLPDPNRIQKVAYFTHLGGFFCGWLVARGRNHPGSSLRNFKIFTGGRSNWPPFGGRND